MTLPGSEKATPRPWTWAAHIKVTNILGISRSGSRFVLAQCRFGGPVAMANAALIVEAVNGWDALKEDNRRLSNIEKAARTVLDQFEAIKAHQHRLLIEGQTLESDSRNWEEATDIPGIDFEPLIKALNNGKDRG